MEHQPLCFSKTCKLFKDDLRRCTAWYRRQSSLYHRRSTRWSPHPVYPWTNSWLSDGTVVVSLTSYPFAIATVLECMYAESSRRLWLQLTNLLPSVNLFAGTDNQTSQQLLTTKSWVELMFIMVTCYVLYDATMFPDATWHPGSTPHHQEIPASKVMNEHQVCFPCSRPL